MILRYLYYTTINSIAIYMVNDIEAIDFKSSNDR